MHFTTIKRYAEKKGNFKQYNEDRVNKLRDKMAYQLVPSPDSKR